MNGALLPCSTDREGEDETRYRSRPNNQPHNDVEKQNFVLQPITAVPAFRVK